MKLKGPEEGGKHQEELHPGKLLSRTHPMPWKQRERSRDTPNALEAEGTVKGKQGTVSAPKIFLHIPFQGPALFLIPAEKGRKASLATKFPSLSRKWPGLN